MLKKNKKKKHRGRLQSLLDNKTPTKNNKPLHSKMFLCAAVNLYANSKNCKNGGPWALKDLCALHYYKEI